MTNIIPRHGSYKGNENVQIFLGTMNSGFSTIGHTDFEIFIDDVVCAPTAFAISPDIKVDCTTGARSFDYEGQPSLRIYIKGNMVATQGRVYRYVAAWSDVDTWGPALRPMAGESVQVPAGRNLLLDENTPALNLVILDGGSLIVNCSPDDAEAPTLTLAAQYIFLNSGSYMEVGTEEQPCLSKVFIVLAGKKHDPVMPLFGNKVIAVRGGTLEMHGSPVGKTWSTLKMSVPAGVTTLHVVDEVHTMGWKVNDRIVIASTNTDDGGTGGSEVHVIQQINGPGPGGGSLITVGAVMGLAFKHYGATDSYLIDGQTK